MIVINFDFDKIFSLSYMEKTLSPAKFLYYSYDIRILSWIVIAYFKLIMDLFV